MRNNKLLLLLLPLLSLTINSCNVTQSSPSVEEPTTPSKSVEPTVTPSFEPTEIPTEEPTEEPTETPTEEPTEKPTIEPTPEPTVSNTPEINENNVIPSNVLNADLSIDFFVYNLNADGKKLDIGNYSEELTDNPNDYHPIDIFSIEMARYFGAAAAFKKIVPNVKINLIYYSDFTEFNDKIYEYLNENSHLPHLIYGPDQAYKMLAKGLCADLSKYSNSTYYQAYNDYLLNQYNYGGFQAAFPFYFQPCGMLVNVDSLKEYNVLANPIENDTYTDEYKNWVDNLTWDNFISAVKLTTTDNHAGISDVSDYPISNSLENINKSLIENNKIDLTSDENLPTITKLIQYEQELSQYCVYEYNDFSYGQKIAKPGFKNAASWNVSRNFLSDKYYTFNFDSQWIFESLSRHANSQNIDINIDYLPYPKINENSTAYTSNTAEGLVVGELCPVGLDGKKRCYSPTAELEMDVAAYFAMFMGLDPRAIESQSKIKYNSNVNDNKGFTSLPLIEKGIRFDFQESIDLATEYEDNWQYQLALYLSQNNLYITDGKNPDVKNFSNIPYGLTKVLDSVYGENITSINIYTTPCSSALDNWFRRHTKYMNQDTLLGTIGSSTYVETILKNLKTIEEEANTNSENLIKSLQEALDVYYGSGKYKVVD